MLTNVHKSPRLTDGTAHTSWTIHSVWTKRTFIPGTRCPRGGQDSSEARPGRRAEEMQMVQRWTKQSTNGSFFLSISLNYSFYLSYYLHLLFPSLSFVPSPPLPLVPSPLTSIHLSLSPLILLLMHFLLSLFRHLFSLIPLPYPFYLPLVFSS